MSRIGNQAIAVPSGVTATIDGRVVKIKGSKGELDLTLVDEVEATLEDGSILLQPAGADDEPSWANRNEEGSQRPDVRRLFSKRARSMWGMQRTLIANMIEGVSTGFTKKLELNGVGYRAQMQGTKLKLQLGLSHDVIFEPPQGIKLETPKPTEIIITGVDKQLVGQVAADIRKWRPPEPYKGKGIKYEGEYIRRKEGKKK